MQVFQPFELYTEFVYFVLQEKHGWRVQHLVQINPDYISMSFQRRISAVVCARDLEENGKPEIKPIV